MLFLGSRWACLSSVYRRQNQRRRVLQALQIECVDFSPEKRTALFANAARQISEPTHRGGTRPVASQKDRKKSSQRVLLFLRGGAPECLRGCVHGAHQTANFRQFFPGFLSRCLFLTNLQPPATYRPPCTHLTTRAESSSRALSRMPRSVSLSSMYWC